MATVQELAARLDAAEAELRRRDREAAEAKAAALAVQNRADDAAALAERVKAEAAQRENVRRGAWCRHLLGQADSAAQLDFAALEKSIPPDADQWPPGSDVSKFIIAAPLPKEKTVAVGETTLGKLLASKGRI